MPRIALLLGIVVAGLVAVIISAPHLSSADSNVASSVDDARLNNADDTPEEWLSYGGTREEQRHSKLKQINSQNVQDLGVAWTYQLSTARGVEATPIVVDGVMFVTSAWSVVYALDAKTGEELWVHDPEVDRAVGAKACCDVVNRGVAVYKGKVFVGVIDGRLQALDASTGKVIWSKVTVDQSKPYTITGAPRVVKDKVLIGNGGAELGVRGYISAYDANSGGLVWRFYTTPNPDKKPDGAASDDVFKRFANRSWGDSGEWKTDGGGGTVWDSIIYDDVNDRVIFGVGNGSPWLWTRRDPSGRDNLFVSSIVAVDADTGVYAWHFQTSPGDTWDYTATQTIIIADLPIGEGGSKRRVVMQAPKNGFYYVLDAATGEYISARNFVPQNWTDGLDESGRPKVKKEARDLTVAYLQKPGPFGAHNWHPMAFNPDLNLAYIPAQEIPQDYRAEPRLKSKPAPWNIGVDLGADLPLEIPKAVMKALRAMMKGRLIAWDPVKQEARWTVEHSNAWNGGVLSTAGGLVFQGKLAGEFAAYQAETGKKLWSADLKSGAASGPSTYEIDGEQFVAITTGWGTAFSLIAGYGYDQPVAPELGKVVVFKLGAKGSIPDPELDIVAPEPPTDRFGDKKTLQEGLWLYSNNCFQCHGGAAVGSGVTPDLRWSPVAADAEDWRDVVLGGSRASNGMVSFAKVLTKEDAEAIRAYVIDQAHNAVEN